MRRRRPRSTRAFTLVEVVMAMAVLAVFMGGIYAINSQTVSIMRSKRNVGAASQLLQERVESFRMATWAKMTSADGIEALLTNETQTEKKGFMGASELIEEVTITAYDPTSGKISGNSIQARREEGAVSASGTISGSATMVRIDATVQWNEMGRELPARRISTVMSAKGFTSKSISRKQFEPATVTSYP